MDDPILRVLIRACLDEHRDPAHKHVLADIYLELGLDKHAEFIRLFAEGLWSRAINNTTLCYSTRSGYQLLISYHARYPHVGIPWRTGLDREPWIWEIAVPNTLSRPQGYHGRSPNTNNAMRRAMLAILIHHPYKQGGKRKCLCTLL